MSFLGTGKCFRLDLILLQSARSLHPNLPAFIMMVASDTGCLSVAQVSVRFCMPSCYIEFNLFRFSDSLSIN